MKKTIFFIIILLTNWSYAQQPGLVMRGFIYEKAPYVECHASTIAYTPDGAVAAWFGGTKEANKDVEIWVSRYQNGIWKEAVSVANGIQHSQKRYPCWNPVLYQVPKGELMLFYKVGPSPQTWWGELITSKDSGKTWSLPIRLPEDILGPIKNKPVLLSNGVLLSPVSTEEKHDAGWKIHFEVTKDNGKTWELYDVVDSASKINAIQPSVLFHKGSIQLLARSLKDGLVESWSYDNAKTWTPLRSTGLPNPNSGTDAVTLRDGRQLLIYNNAEKPEGKWGGKRTPLNLAVSRDGVKWKDVAILENEAGEYSYPSIIQGSDGFVYITYTWKRRKISYAVFDPSKF